MLSLYTCVPQMMIIWRMVPEIWSAQEKIFVISGYFLSFCPSNSLKNENLKKMKKHLEISSFNTSSPKIMIIVYMVPEIWRVADVIAILHFGPYFFLLPPSEPKKWKFQKNEKNA